MIAPILEDIFTCPIIISTLAPFPFSKASHKIALQLGDN